MAIEKDAPTDKDESNPAPILDPNAVDSSKTDKIVTNANENLNTPEKTNINTENSPVKSSEVRNFQMLSQQSEGDMSQDSVDVMSADESMETPTPPPPPMPPSQPSVKKLPAVPPRPVSQLNDEDSQGSNTSHFNLPPGLHYIINKNNYFEPS